MHDNVVMLIVPSPIQASEAHERPVPFFFLPWSMAEGWKGFEQEQQSLSDEILRFRGRCSVHDHDGRFKGNSLAWDLVPTVPPPVLLMRVSQERSQWKTPLHNAGITHWRRPGGS